MGVLQTRVLELAAEQSAPPWLADLRQRGAERFAAAPWPTRRTEHWRYTPLAALAKKQLVISPQPEADLQAVALCGGACLPHCVC